MSDTPHAAAAAADSGDAAALASSHDTTAAASADDTRAPAAAHAAAGFGLSGKFGGAA